VSDRDFVLSRHPSAWSHKTRLLGIKRWYNGFVIIEAVGKSGFIGHGKTDSAAWSSAKEIIIEREKNEDN